MANKKRVAVIGVGQAGLCVIKQLAQHAENFDIIAFERQADVGGQWLNTQKPEMETVLPFNRNKFDDLTMYLPFELLEIPGFPHKAGHSYLTGSQILRYLHDYAETFDLRKHVTFNTMVTKVKPVTVSSDLRWEVTHCDVRNQSNVTKQMFDTIVVSVGHTDMPFIPDITGMDLFQGTVMHSCNYQKRALFKNKRALIVGSSYSALNIAFQISHAANKVFMATDNGCLRTTLPDNVSERREIQQMTNDSVIFEDGTEEKVDFVIFCTGYIYNFPFLDDVISVTDEHVMPIYKHVVHIEYPSLMFVGLPKCMAYFPQNHEIARFVVRYLLGLVQLPSKKDMYDDEQNDNGIRTRLGYDETRSHYMGEAELQWRFNTEISQLAGFDPLPPILKMIWDVAIDKLQTDFGHFREYNYTVTSSDTFICDHALETTYL